MLQGILRRRLSRSLPMYLNCIFFSNASGRCMSDLGTFDVCLVVPSSIGSSTLSWNLCIDPKEYTEEQKDALNTFAEAMTQIKQHQEKLKQDMIYARKEVASTIPPKKMPVIPRKKSVIWGPFGWKLEQWTFVRSGRSARMWRIRSPNTTANAELVDYPTENNPRCATIYMALIQAWWLELIILLVAQSCSADVKRAIMFKAIKDWLALPEKRVGSQSMHMVLPWNS